MSIYSKGWKELEMETEVKHVKSFVDGEHVDPVECRLYDLVNPSRGEAFAGTPASEKAEVDQVFSAAEKAFRGWRDSLLPYVFDVNYTTRPEDRPVVPADAVSFSLEPFGFFDRNPAPDVPPTCDGRCYGPGGVQEVTA